MYPYQRMSPKHIKDLKTEIRKYQEFFAYASILLSTADLPPGVITKLRRTQRELMLRYSTFLENKKTKSLAQHFYFLSDLINACAALMITMEFDVRSGCPIRKRIFDESNKILMPDYMYWYAHEP